jgi:hypothetical protein
MKYVGKTSSEKPAQAFVWAARHVARLKGKEGYEGH